MYWVNAGGDDEDLQNDLDTFGIIAEDIEFSSDNVFEIWPDNLDTMLMFLRMGTQWRVSMTGLLGMDYNVLFDLFNLYGTVDRVIMLEDLQAMERAVIKAVNDGKAA